MQHATQSTESLKDELAVATRVVNQLGKIDPEDLTAMQAESYAASILDVRTLTEELVKRIIAGGQYTAREVVDYKGRTELMVHYNGYSSCVPVGKLELAITQLLNAERIDAAYAAAKLERASDLIHDGIGLRARGGLVYFG